MILFDSNVWIALFNGEDTLHSKAEGYFAKVIEKNEDILITDYIILEVSSVLQRRLGHEESKNFLEYVLSTKGIMQINVDEITFLQIVDLFKKGNHKLSFVDISIVLLKKSMNLGVFTFDDGLSKALKAD